MWSRSCALVFLLLVPILAEKTLDVFDWDKSSTSAEHDTKAKDAETGDEDEDDERYDTNFRGDKVQYMNIESSFNNQQSFSCQLVKNALRTGDSGANLSPEDIRIVAAMGDAISTGIGLWGGLNIEFRGAAFTIGGDATIDGLVTFPNILSAFSPSIEGTSHGMGTASKLPDHQFNVAEGGAETDTMPEQATELVRRLHKHYSIEELTSRWVLIFVAVGTEELCDKCDAPNIPNLRRALITLKHAIPKALVVIVGPVHVARSSLLNYNLLKPRCDCLAKLTNRELRKIQTQWSEELLKLEVEFSSRKYASFPVLTLPKLTIESRNPEQLFISKRPLLNRKGHTYAAKWLWNRLISGPKYNATKIPLSEDTYYCPPVACPYFRTPANLEHCKIMTLDEYRKRQKAALEAAARSFDKSHNMTALERRRETMRHYMGLWIAGPVVLCTITVFILGTIFYCHGMHATQSRFEHLPGV